MKQRTWEELEAVERERWVEVLHDRTARHLGHLARMMVEGGIGCDGRLDAGSAAVASWALVTMGAAGLLALPGQNDQALIESLTKGFREQLVALVGDPGVQAMRKKQVQH